MNELNLEWIEAGSLKTKSILPNQPSKNPGTVRLGRDPDLCDIVLSDGSVSGLHIEIFFDQASQQFMVQNLRSSNPAIINGQSLPAGSLALAPENTIQLGNLQIRAIATGSPPQAPFIPPTEIQIPGGSTPIPPQGASTPLSPLPQQAYPSQDPTAPIYQPNPWEPSPAYPNASGGPSPGIFPATAPVSNELPPRKNNLLWIIPAAILAAALLGLAGHFMTDKDSEPAEQDQSERESSTSATSRQSESTSFMADLEFFEHPSRLFSINTPEGWTYEENDEAEDIVISSWRHPSIYSLVVVRIENVSRSLNRQGLEDVGREVVTDLLKELDDFRTGNATGLFNGSVKIPWTGRDEGTELIGTSFVRQDGSKFSHVIVWTPKRLSSKYKDLPEEINEVVKSLSVDPNVDIP